MWHRVVWQVDLQAFRINLIRLSCILNMLIGWYVATRLYGVTVIHMKAFYQSFKRVY